MQPAFHNNKGTKNQTIRRYKKDFVLDQTQE